jgi:glutathione S-transferase
LSFASGLSGREEKLAGAAPGRTSDQQKETEMEIRRNGSQPSTKPAGEESVLGSQYSVADPCTFVIYGWGRLHGLPLEQLGNYTAFKDRMLQRPVVRNVLEREQSRLLRG